IRGSSEGLVVIREGSPLPTRAGPVSSRGKHVGDNAGNDFPAAPTGPGVPGRSRAGPGVHLRPAGAEHRGDPGGAAAARHAGPLPPAGGRRRCQRGRLGQLVPVAAAPGSPGRPGVPGAPGASFVAYLLLSHRPAVGRTHHDGERDGRGPYPVHRDLGRGLGGRAAGPPGGVVPAGLRALGRRPAGLGPAHPPRAARIRRGAALAAARRGLRHRRPRQQRRSLGCRRGRAGRPGLAAWPRRARIPPAHPARRRAGAGDQPGTGGAAGLAPRGPAAAGLRLAHRPKRVKRDFPAPGKAQPVLIARAGLVRQIWPALYTGEDGSGCRLARRQSRAAGSGPGGGTMTSGVSVGSAWAVAASTSSSFSWTEAAVIFVVVIVALLVIVALVGRRTRLLVSSPRLRTTHSRRVRQAAEEDVAEIERDARLYGRPVSGSRRREEEDDAL